MLGLALVGASQANPEAFIADAQERDSDAVVVVQDGVEVVRWEKRPGRRMNTHSITKSISAVAIGQLVDAGDLQWDDRMRGFFPEWADDERGDITLAQVLEHSSGLDPERASLPLRPTRDALRSDLVAAPGATFAYSNNATNLLGGVVERATGDSLRAQIEHGIFQPLGISGPRWGLHLGPTPAWSGLRLTADELLAIGLAMAAGSLLDAPTQKRLTEPGSITPWCGGLWWPVYVTEFVIEDETLDDLVRNGMPVERVEPMKQLVGQRYATWQEAWNTLDRHVNRHEISMTGTSPLTTRSYLAGYSAEGWAGQHLLVLPEAGVVAVRQRRSNWESEGYDPRAWTGFGQDVIELLDLREQLTAGRPTRWAAPPTP